MIRRGISDAYFATSSASHRKNNYNIVHAWPFEVCPKGSKATTSWPIHAVYSTDPMFGDCPRFANIVPPINSLCVLLQGTLLVSPPSRPSPRSILPSRPPTRSPPGLDILKFLCLPLLLLLARLAHHPDEKGGAIKALRKLLSRPHLRITRAQRSDLLDFLLREVVALLIRLPNRWR